MNAVYPEHKRGKSFLSSLLTGLAVMPLIASCQQAAPPPVNDSRYGASPYPSSYPARQQPRQEPRVNRGLSTGQKVAILAGAAALFYLYNQHKNAQGQGAQGQYYLSKNGRVYYRDDQHRVHWVTPPPGGIQVPESEAQQYRDFQGYNNRPTGRTLEGMGADPVPAQ